MPQLNYSFISDKKGVEGQIASQDSYTRSGLNVSGNVIPFGRGLFYTGASDEEVDVVNAPGQDFAGVAVWSQIYEDVADGAGDSGIPDQKYFHVLYKGSIFVRVDSAVAKGDPVYVRHTANGAGKDVLGRFGNSADTGTAELVANARWMTSAANGEIATLALNLA